MGTGSQSSGRGTFASVIPEGHSSIPAGPLPQPLGPTTEQTRELIPWSQGASLREYETLLSRTASRIALFEFRDPLPLDQHPSSIINLLWESPSRCVKCNPAFVGAYGMSEVELAIGLPVRRFFPRTEISERLFREWAQHNFVLPRFDVPVVESGRQRTLLVALYPIINGDGVKKFWYIARDITETTDLLREFQRAEAHYRTLVEQPGLLMFRRSPQGGFHYVSPLATELLAASSEELLANHHLLRSLVHPDDVAHYDALLIDSSEIRCGASVELRLQSRDGTFRHFIIRVVPKFDQREAIEYYDILALDIQERKLLELQLMHSQRMETIGTLAGGIAHDFNNYLTAILGQLGLALQTLDPQHPSYATLMGAEASALRCSEMTRQLLGFSRKGEVARELLNPETVVGQTVTLLKHSLPATMTITLAIEENLPAIRAHFAQIQQVLMNLAVNARDAMHEKGTLIIAVRRITLASPLASPRPYASLAAGDYIEISVQDNGSGIPPENIPHIFEPFFTTKPASRGTGLGLSSVYSIVHNHEGAIDVQSEVGVGTTISIALPASPDPAPATTAQGRAFMPTGSETILIADDDEMVRSVLASALSLQGYTVIEAVDGEVAIQRFREHHDLISLALIDQTMPRVTGRAVAERLTALNPALPIIISSGYGSVPTDDPLRDNPEIHFLAKPYSIPDLFRFVRAILDRRAPGCDLASELTGPPT